MKIQPQKNANLPKYAAVIAAAMSAGMLGSLAATSAAADYAEPTEELMKEGTAPAVMWTTELAGTSPGIMQTEAYTTPVRLEGVPPIVTTPETETAPLRMEGTSPSVTTVIRPTETLVFEGTYPAPTTLAPETTTTLRLEGTSPAPTPGATETTPVMLEGDIAVPEYELTDVVKLQKHLLGKAPADQKMRALMDLDGDGVLDTYDLALMKRELLKQRRRNG